MTKEFKETVQNLRAEIGETEKQVRDLVQHQAFASGASEGSPNADPQEMIANIVLSFRHLEDARMRLGKVLQAMEGRVSAYDRKGESADASAYPDPTDDSPRSLTPNEKWLNSQMPSRLR